MVLITSKEKVTVMNKIMISSGIVVIGLVVTILCVGLWIMSIFNTEVRLRNTFEAKKKHIETAHDTMWKTISQKYKISTDYKETFIQGIQALSSGRQGGGLFKSTTEASNQLGLPTDVFTSMMATIEGQRAMLKREQDTLADMWRAHKTYCEIMPNSVFIGSKVLPEPVMITSTKTQQAVESGVDDDISM